MYEQVQVLGFQYLECVAAAIQNPGEPSTGLEFLDRYSIVVLGDLTMVMIRTNFYAEEKNTHKLYNQPIDSCLYELPAADARCPWAHLFSNISSA